MLKKLSTQRNDMQMAQVVGMYVGAYIFIQTDREKIIPMNKKITT